MRGIPSRLAVVTVLLLALGLAALLRAGEPIPDIDVILEQIPGPHFSVIVRPPEGGDAAPVSDVDVLLQKIPAGLAFDGVRLSGDRALRDLTIDELPPGWGLQRKGRRLELSGPAVTPPIRFRLVAGDQRPTRLDVELLADGEVGFARRGIVPREVPLRRVAGTLEGTVRLPSKVSPGETIALRALPEANLPPGAWVISGTVSEPAVSEPWTDEDLRATQRDIMRPRHDVKMQSIGNIRAAVDLNVTLLGGHEDGDGDCDALAPTAAGLLARDNFETSKSNTIDWLTAHSEQALSVEMLPPVHGASPNVVAAAVPSAAASRHLLSRGKLGAGLRASYAFVLADGDDPGFAIKEEGVHVAVKEEGVNVDFEEDGAPEQTDQAISIKEKGVQRVLVRAPGSGSSEPAEAVELSVRTLDRGDAAGAAHLSEISEEMIVLAALDAEPVAGGCRFTSREPTELDELRLRRARTKKSFGQHFGTIAKGTAAASVAHLLTLPSDLQPGEPLSVRYLDEWGDPWVEVSEVPDVEVVAADDATVPRRIEGAGRYVVAGRSVCVCVGFDALDIATPFRFGEHTMQATSIGRTTAWLVAPEDALGPQLIQAEGLRGEAATDVIRIAAELDQEHLLSGQKTPLRLSVQGTEQSVRIELVNRSPQIITLEGGNDQSLETPGGADNSVVRQVSAQERGSFQLFWEVPPAPCPCSEAPR